MGKLPRRCSEILGHSGKGLCAAPGHCGEGKLPQGKAQALGGQGEQRAAQPQLGAATLPSSAGRFLPKAIMLGTSMPSHRDDPPVVSISLETPKGGRALLEERVEDTGGCYRSPRPLCATEHGSCLSQPHLSEQVAHSWVVGGRWLCLSEPWALCGVSGGWAMAWQGGSEETALAQHMEEKMSMPEMVAVSIPALVTVCRTWYSR